MGVELEADPADHERRAGLARERRDPCAQRGDHLERARHRGLRPHDQLGAGASGRARERFVGLERLLDRRRAPLHALVDVALDHRGADRLRLAGRSRRGEPEPVQRDHGRERREHPHAGPRARARRTNGFEQRCAPEHAHEREPVHARERSEPEQRGIVVLRITQLGPREARQRERAQMVERGPRERGAPGRCDPARGEPRVAEPEESRRTPRCRTRARSGRSRRRPDGRVRS